MPSLLKTRKKVYQGVLGMPTAVAVPMLTGVRPTALATTRQEDWEMTPNRAGKDADMELVCSYWYAVVRARITWSSTCTRWPLATARLASPFPCHRQPSAKRWASKRAWRLP